MKANGQYKFAAFVLALSSIMHFMAILMGQFKSDVIGLVLPLVVYLLLALLLNQGRRLGAWLGFLCMLVGITAGVLRLYSSSLVPEWVFQSIVALNVLSALVLFVILWKSKSEQVSEVQVSARL